MAQDQEVRYLTPVAVDTKKKKYCRFKKSGIKYIDYTTRIINGYIQSLIMHLS